MLKSLIVQATAAGKLLKNDKKRKIYTNFLIETFCSKKEVFEVESQN